MLQEEYSRNSRTVDKSECHVKCLEESRMIIDYYHCKHQFESKHLPVYVVI